LICAVTVNGPSTPSAGSGQAGSGQGKPWTSYDKDKKPMTNNPNHGNNRKEKQINVITKAETVTKEMTR
jgi:hypothetical protein